jgi:hypothetical protein
MIGTKGKNAQLLTPEEKTKIESYCKEGAVEDWEPDSRLFSHSWFIDGAILIILTICGSLTAHAQEHGEKGTAEKPATIEVPQWVKNIKLSGFAMVQYQTTYEDEYEEDDNETSTFNLRFMRLTLDGKIGDFDWRTQIQGTNVRGAGEPTVQLLDLYAEWTRYKAFRVRAGQFQRPFSFESTIHPISQGFFDLADVIKQLTGFGDRAGEKSSAGRDIGVQVQGDILPNSAGRALLHYQVGLFNGEGINRKDKNNHKDLAASVWVMPIEGLRLGVSGWTGSHGGMIVTDDAGRTTEGDVPLNRYCLSAEYDKDDYTFRAEYIHSQGWGTGVIGSRTVDYSLGDKADGWYVLGIVPVIKKKLQVKARYQTYRESKEWGSSKNLFEVGANYFFSKNMQLNFEYARVNDRTIDRKDYNILDVQLNFRF